MYLNSVNAAANRMIQNCGTIILLYILSLPAVKKSLFIVLVMLNYQLEVSFACRYCFTSNFPN